MENQIKIWKFTYRTWWYIFYCLQGLLAILIVGMLSSPRWIYSNSEFTVNTTIYDPSTNRIFETVRFKGGLIRCKSGCTDSFGNLSSDWCAYYDDLDEQDVESLCKMFTVLYLGGAICVLFEIIGLIAIIVWFSSMVCYMGKIKSIMVSFCCSVCVCISHYIAIIVWLGITGATYNDDCSEIPKDGERVPLCASDGPSLGLFLLLFIPVVVGLYMFIGCKIKMSHGFDGFGGKLEPVIVETVSNANGPFVEMSMGVNKNYGNSFVATNNTVPDAKIKNISHDISGFDKESGHSLKK
ncbi:hypothetical protein SteCoe_10496 [Stentor coeruleus]|uniref:Uncharacterized protein n=1 Tax=Stentor coeruleus TaxID=5963 RepID=A0A1R2CFF5_9CILI|nr:hypothetical protein SteCoe_10496 [Stentor coeruleus]